MISDDKNSRPVEPHPELPNQNTEHSSQPEKAWAQEDSSQSNQNQ